MSEEKLTGLQRADDTDQASLQVRSVLDLASLHATDAFERPDDALEEFLDDLLDTRHFKAHPSVLALRKTAKEASKYELAELGYQLYRQNLLGLVVKFATPVMTKTSATSWSFSWGYTQSTWIYAETYDDAWRLGVAWANKCRDGSRPSKNSMAEAA